MIATKEKVTAPSNNDVLEVGRDRSVGVLMEIILEDVNSLSSGVKRLTDVDGSVIEADELVDITNCRREVLESIRRDEDTAVDGGGKP